MPAEEDAMSATGLSVFDETLHLTNAWLKEVSEAVGWDDRQRSYRALRATLHALRDRVPTDVAAHLAAQLPMLVRGFYFEGWRPSATPTADRTAADFVGHVVADFRTDPLDDPEAVVRACLKVVAARVSDGETAQIKKALPEDIRGLWPD
jgi:uncharacterized protein (DUF2267 family)